MIIDSHTHTFPEKIVDAAVPKMEAAAKIKARLRGTLTALSGSIRDAGIDMAINLPVATNPAQPRKLNTAAISINEQTADTGIMSFGAMHPDDPNWREELTFIAENGIKGIKLHPMYQGVAFDDIRYERIIGKAAELGLCVTVHAGEDIGIPGPSKCSPDHILRVLRDTGADKLIFAHMGGWGLWDRVKGELCGAPVYIDTSFSFGKATFNPLFPRTQEELKMGNTELLREIILSHGASRILFGSDSPWGDEKSEIENIKALRLSAEDTELVFSGNMTRLLNL